MLQQQLLASVHQSPIQVLSTAAGHVDKQVAPPQQTGISLRHVVKGTMKCDVSKSPSEPTFAPLQRTSPLFETSALESGPSDGVTVSLLDEALNFKTLSKEALAARDDRMLYAWLCP